MFDNLSFGECVGTIMGIGLLLRFGSLIADSFLNDIKWLFSVLKLHFQNRRK